MSPANPTLSVPITDPLPGLALTPWALDLAMSTPAATPPTKTPYETDSARSDVGTSVARARQETALAETPADSARLFYSITVVSPSGLKLSVGTGDYGVPLDGFLEPSSIVSGLSIEQLRRLLIDCMAEPLLRRANLTLNQRVKELQTYDPAQQPGYPSDANPFASGS